LDFFKHFLDQSWSGELRDAHFGADAGRHHMGLCFLRLWHVPVLGTVFGRAESECYYNGSASLPASEQQR